MTDKQSYVCIGSIGAYRPGDAIAEGALTDERIKSLLDAGMIKAGDGVQSKSDEKLAAGMTLSEFSESCGIAADTWSDVFELIKAGQDAIAQLAGLKAALPATDPIKPESTPAPAATVPPAPADMSVAEIKAALDAKGVTYTTRDTKADLLALLTA